MAIHVRIDKKGGATIGTEFVSVFHVSEIVAFHQLFASFEFDVLLHRINIEVTIFGAYGAITIHD